MIAKTPRKMRAVSYVRMSTGMQDDSPEQQRGTFPDLIAKLEREHNWSIELTREYLDEAISGTKDKRQRWQELLNDAQSGRFDLILCWAQSRLFRVSPRKANYYWSILDDAGVQIATAKEGLLDLDDIGGWLKASITAHSDQMHSKNTGMDLLRGILARLRAHGEWRGRAPFGYDRRFVDPATGEEKMRVKRGDGIKKPNKAWRTQLVPNEDAELVRSLFERFASTDISARAMVVELNKKGVPASEGGEWSPVKLLRMFKRKAYLGHTVYGENPQGSQCHVGSGGKVVERSQVAKGEAETGVVRVDNTHEAIVDKELFDRVQAKMGRRKLRKGRAKANPYLLSGLLRCGHCGGTLVGCQSSKRRAYYICRDANGTGRCKRRSVSVELMEAAAIDAVKEWLDGQREALLSDAAREVEGVDLSTVGDLRRQRQRLAKLDQQIDQGTENLLLLKESASVPAMSRKLDDWQRQRAELAAEIDRLERQQDATEGRLTPEEVLAGLDHLHSSLAANEPLAVREALRSTFDQITLWWPTDRKSTQPAKILATVCGLSEPSAALRCQNTTHSLSLNRWQTEAWRSTVDVLEQLAADGPVMARTIAERQGLAYKTVLQRLQLASKEGAARCVGAGSARKWLPSEEVGQ